jgi:membrane protein required for beta-lactamase induction
MALVGEAETGFRVWRAGEGEIIARRSVVAVRVAVLAEDEA